MSRAVATGPRSVDDRHADVNHAGTPRGRRAGSSCGDSHPSRVPSWPPSRRDRIDGLRRRVARPLDCGMHVTNVGNARPSRSSGGRPAICSSHVRRSRADPTARSVAARSCAWRGLGKSVAGSLLPHPVQGGNASGAAPLVVAVGAAPANALDVSIAALVAGARRAAATVESSEFTGARWVIKSRGRPHATKPAATNAAPDAVRAYECPHGQSTVPRSRNPHACPSMVPATQSIPTGCNPPPLTAGVLEGAAALPSNATVTTEPNQTLARSAILYGLLARYASSHGPERQPAASHPSPLRNVRPRAHSSPRS